jgi:hypothetical protein
MVLPAASNRSGNRAVSVSPMFEQLEPRVLLSASPSPFEQEMLWLINDMRTEPSDHLDHFITGYGTPASSSDSDIQGAMTDFGVVGSILQSDWSDLIPVAPLAWSSQIDDVAEFHSQYMIDEDDQRHSFSGEPSLLDRIIATGYDLHRWGENIFAYSKSALHGHAGFIVDWGRGATGMQTPPGHRDNIMQPYWVHVGIAAIAESSEDTEVGPYVVTQDFTKPWTDVDPYLVGTIWSDANADGKFDGGEGFGGVNVTAVGAATYSTTSWGSGGYQLQLPAGTYDVSISSGTFAGTDMGSVTISDENVKLDANPQGNGVVGRHIFYNNSVWDDVDPGSGQADDAAIAWDKSPMRPGRTVGPVNYTAQSQGLNGLMVDIYNPIGAPVLSDFAFRAGVDPDPSNWSAAPTPAFTVRQGAGGGGSDRVTLIWPDGAITNKWVEVTVLANGNTGLAENDVFYFANVVGDSDGDGAVDAGDYGAFVSEFGDSGAGALDSDFNADGLVDLSDFVSLRANFGNAVDTPTTPAAPSAKPNTTSNQSTVIRDQLTTTTAPAVSSAKPHAVDVIDEGYLSGASDPSIAAPVALAPLVDLLVESLSPGEYVSDSAPVLADSPQFVATGEYDLRPLGDDPAVDGDGDLLVDVLAESALA